MRPRLFILCAFMMLLAVHTHAQASSTVDSWQVSDPGFRAIGITSNPSAFWVCGVSEGIASSTDGLHWEIKHQETDGALLLGIGFASETFGYAYGTSGILLTTEDGGATWLPHHLGGDPILLASFSDPTHGVFRTGSALFYLDGSDSAHPITQPADILRRFSYTSSLVAINAQKMGILLSEGAYSEAGFLTTTDGGKTWAFYDPPSTGLGSFLRMNGKYWATGDEVVGKDKPGGGHSIPLAITSEDGLHWEHSSHDIKTCHWQSCGLCTTAGCLASNTLLINFFGPETTYFAIPKGNLTAKWAALQNRICSIHNGVTCAVLGTPVNVQAAGDPKPFEQPFPSLNAKVPPGNGLRCLACALEPVYVEEQVEGRFTIHVALLVRPDGTTETVELKNAPSDSLERKIHAQMIEWLFEPPVRDGKPVRVSTQTDVTVNVVRSR